jgi:hypothetical protein
VREKELDGRRWVHARESTGEPSIYKALNLSACYFEAVERHRPAL